MRQKDDLISRQAALSYIDRIMHQGTGKQKSFEFIRKHVEKMPSAEMPKRTEKFIQNVPNVDLISRKTAIEALLEYERDSTAPIDYRGILMALPFAQPDLSEYSEKLWRAAYERGKKEAQPEVAKRIVGMSRDGMTMWYQCDMCHEPVDEKDAFCRGCGRRLADER